MNEYHFGENKEIDKIILDTHNEYRKHSANWGRKKEIQVICERTGLDKENTKQALYEMEHPYGKEWLLEREVENAKMMEEQRAIKQQQNLVKQQAAYYKGLAKCPRCHSTSISYDTKKLSIGRALVGDVIAGAPGAILGGLSSKKGYAVCLNCGKRWKV